MSKFKFGKVHYAWVICACCFIIMVFTSPLVNALASHYLLAVTQELGISRSAFTLTSTLVAVCGMLLSPLWGKIYQSKNMRLTLTVSFLLFGLSYMSYSFAHNKYQFYIAAICVGITYSGCAFMPMSMLITSWFKKSRGLAMSIALGGIGIGGALLSPFISWIIRNNGWRWGYRYVGLITIVIGVPILWIFVRQTPEKCGMQPYGANSDNKEAVTIKEKKVSEEIEISFQESKNSAFFWLHMLGMFFMGIICSAPLRQISPYVADLHGQTFAALIVSLYSFFGIFGKLILGWINDRLGTIRGSMVAFTLMILTFTLILFRRSPMLLYIMTFIYGTGNGIGTVCAPLLVSATFGTKNFNLMRGITQSPMQLGMSLGGLLLAGVYDLCGSYFYGWILCIVISVIAAICFYVSYKQAYAYTQRTRKA